MHLSMNQDWYQVKNHFYHTGHLPTDIHLDPQLLQIWEKAKASGLSPDSPVRLPVTETLSQEEIELSRMITPLMKNIWELFKYQNICTFFMSTSFKIIAEKQEETEHSPYYFLKTGHVLSPEQFGAIAPCYSIVTQQPLIMMGHQHYLNAFSEFSCASVPVFNGQGKILGALDITSFREHLASNWLRHLLYQSYVFENTWIKANIHPKHQILYFQHSEDLLQTAYAGLIELNQHGQIVKANQMALTLLNVKIEDLLSTPISQYFNFNTPLTELHHQVGLIRSLDQALFYAQIATTTDHDISTEPVSTTFSLHKHIQRSIKILQAGVPLLITGETGTGKEDLAKKIHQIVAPNQPFIGLNCAAIPEHLLESELFGYDAGAFTGANPKGKKGLIELAHEGILFLDEIGDLPLHLQVKLLRVLQEQAFYRVGG
ncbi:MAG: sigma 54-interacting transcriptional regulator, partial [Acinetobacter sp.]